MINPTLGELKEKDSKKETMLDFEGSKEFYSKANAKKGFRIISDEYSNDRNTKLYAGFSKIESDWRVVVAKDEKARKLLEDEELKPRVTRKGRDHRLAQYDLSEFFETFLFSSPSDEYLKNYWDNDSDKNAQTAVEMTKLTRMRELKINLSKEELVNLKNRRNACMHFRTVTPDEFDKTTKIMNKYLERKQMSQLLDSMDGLYRNMSSSLTTSPVIAMGEVIRKITEITKNFR